MEQYPYVLQQRTISPGGVDEFGRPQQGAQNFVPLGRCRDEAKRGDAVVSVGGVVSSFSSFVLTPTTVPDITVGTYIEVRDKDGSTRVSGDVKRFRRGQLHCRLWV